MSTDAIEVVLIGAGQRGAESYGAWALQNADKLRFIAVAEPNAERRERFASDHGIPPERRFADWRELLAQPQLAPALLNATLDPLHEATTITALAAGYDVLLEKPIAPTPQAVKRVVEAAQNQGRSLMICHVLRYAPFFYTIAELIHSGAIGDIVTVQHRENVSYWHMAHSFVRGNWRNEAVAAPMLLAKSCHDLDLLVWLLDRPCERVSSMGRLTHYRPEKIPFAPRSAIPSHCLQGCPLADDCLWYAPRIYLPKCGDWPTTVVSSEQSKEAVMAALERGPYGRCIYRCDNDVVDHQLCIFEFEGGVTVDFSMHGHAHAEGRTMRIEGTDGTLIADQERDIIECFDKRSGDRRIWQGLGKEEGHGGGDAALMESWVRVLRGAELPRTSARLSQESHLMAFAAERARLEGRVVDLVEFR